MQLGIFGVGRSGTTALYAGVQNLLLGKNLNYRYLYEPYLWSHHVFNKPYGDVKHQFGLTSSLSIDGIFTHVNTSLFCEEDNPIHNNFLSLITQDDQNFLIKVIRGSGRLSLFLEKFPELRIVYIIRNPLDTINSVINLFSYFGDEFHPSDKPRFLSEIQQKATVSTKELNRDEVMWSLLWWQYMNRSALRTIESYRDRVFVVAYEVFKLEPVHTFRGICDFFNLDFSSADLQELQRPVGLRTDQINLNPDQINLIKDQADEYWENFIHYSDISCSKSIEEVREEIYSRYSMKQRAETVMARSLVIPTDRNGMSLRQEILRLEQEKKTLLLNQQEQIRNCIQDQQPNKKATIQYMRCLSSYEDASDDKTQEWEHARFAWIKATKRSASI